MLNYAADEAVRGGVDHLCSRCTVHVGSGWRRCIESRADHITAAYRLDAATLAQTLQQRVIVESRCQPERETGSGVVVVMMSP